MTIDVIAEDINTGVPHDCLYCPVALALYRATGRTWYVVGPTALAYHPARAVPLPGMVWHRILAYDDGAPMTPFAFDLDLTLSSAVQDAPGTAIGGGGA